MLIIPLFVVIYLETYSRKHYTSIKPVKMANKVLKLWRPI